MPKQDDDILPLKRVDDAIAQLQALPLVERNRMQRLLTALEKERVHILRSKSRNARLRALSGAASTTP